MSNTVITPKDPRPVTERIQTLDDACRELGKDHPLVRQYHYWMGEAPIYDGSETDLLAYFKLRIITAALNEGWTPQFTEDEPRYYPWLWLYTQEEIDKMDDAERVRIMLTSEYLTEFAGFGCVGSCSINGFRLCFRSDELATYCGHQFIQLWADLTLTRK